MIEIKLTIKADAVLEISSLSQTVEITKKRHNRSEYQYLKAASTDLFADNGALALSIKTYLAEHDDVF